MAPSILPAHRMRQVPHLVFMFYIPDSEMESPAPSLLSNSETMSPHQTTSSLSAASHLDHSPENVILSYSRPHTPVLPSASSTFSSFGSHTQTTPHATQSSGPTSLVDESYYCDGEKLNRGVHDRWNSDFGGGP